MCVSQVYQNSSNERCTMFYFFFNSDKPIVLTLGSMYKIRNKYEDELKNGPYSDRVYHRHRPKFFVQCRPDDVSKTSIRFIHVVTMEKVQLRWETSPGFEPQQVTSWTCVGGSLVRTVKTVRSLVYRRERK